MDNSFSIIEAFVRGLIESEDCGIVEIDDNFSYREFFGLGSLSVDSLDFGMYMYLYLKQDADYGRFTPVIEDSPSYLTSDNDVISLIKVK